jgi:hypothetical protein
VAWKEKPEIKKSTSEKNHKLAFAEAHEPCGVGCKTVTAAKSPEEPPTL